MYHSSSSLEYGDLCLFSCTYILVHALGMWVFTFLLCVLALWMMYVYIYLLASLRCDCHSLCHLRQAMPNFRCDSKVTYRQIFIVEIWHFVWTPLENIDWDHTHSKAKLQSPHTCKAPKANAKIIFFTTNLPRLRFYQNKGLSLDRRCGVPNTFSTRNQTSKPKNQDFFLLSTLD